MILYKSPAHFVTQCPHVYVPSITTSISNQGLIHEHPPILASSWHTTQLFTAPDHHSLFQFGNLELSVAHTINLHWLRSQETRCRSLVLCPSIMFLILYVWHMPLNQNIMICWFSTLQWFLKVQVQAFCSVPSWAYDMEMMSYLCHNLVLTTS